jgi:hypothetical protein
MKNGIMEHISVYKTISCYIIYIELKLKYIQEIKKPVMFYIIYFI